ncbi:MAG: histidinol-phosphate transaminase [Nitrospiraceae bacterium]|nr:histidinol-phosphate transaminase [Nitrospiraceae bacterium]
MMIKAPEHVLAVKAYVPGKPVKELERELGIRNPVKLASNENPLGPSAMALEAIAGASRDIHRYPDGSGYYLKNALSRRLGIDPGCIILGNGSNELIDIAVRTFMVPGDEAVMATPSFVVYSMAVTLGGGKAVEIPLGGPAFGHDLPAMRNAVGPKTRMFFIANPNNPTGTINRREEYGRLFAGLPEDVLVVLDEAYVEYVSHPDYPDSMRYLLEGKNVLILRTFSKIYGLAGLRVGYGISKPGILAQMERVRAPFNTNSIGQAAAIRALEDEAHVARSRAVNEEGKVLLYRELSALGVDFVKTEANFIYMRVSDAQALFNALLKAGVIIRPMGGKAVRVTIGLPMDNRRFLDALKAVLKADDSIKK